MEQRVDRAFWRGRRVFVTGHTGFKGAWLCGVLLDLGAEVYGYALDPDTELNAFELCSLDKRMHSFIGDIRDHEALSRVFKVADPEVVIHMAAQPLVGEGYARPRYTYEVNTMGTVNVLECIRRAESVRSFLNVTTDKVYLNLEDPARRYIETDRLDGFDPYSNSKSCSELITASYARSFFLESPVSISTARSGNVIGGGDFSANRIVPDCVRAALAGIPVSLRNPNSTRPYQHVLEPISAYLDICSTQYADNRFAGSYNVGPDEKSCITTGRLAQLFCASWGEGALWESVDIHGPHEANYLALDASKITEFLGWIPRWGIREAIGKTVAGYKAIAAGEDAAISMGKHIDEYFGE
ncbi:MAG: CDP-glucose 4,6-dehydratase [Raoultibacter sp.]